MIICCYLQYARVCNTASEALQLFAIKRTLNAKVSIQRILKTTKIILQIFH